MSDRFDRLFEHRPDQCPCCQSSLSADLSGETVSEHETVDLPEVRPVVERHRRPAVICPSCRERVVAPVPDTAKKSPFGPRLYAVAVYLKTFRAFSCQRL